MRGWHEWGGKHHSGRTHDWRDTHSDQWQGSSRAWASGTWDSDSWGCGDAPGDSWGSGNVAADTSITERKRKRELREQSTEDGKSYESYTYLGGQEAGSLRDAEKAKAITFMTKEGISRARAASWPSLVLDSVMCFAFISQHPYAHPCSAYGR